MIKAFLFDYDGVITHGVDVKLPAKRLANNTGIPIEKASELIMSIWTRYSTGAISTQEVWNYFESELDIKVAAEKRNIWHTWNELTPLPFMIDFVTELRDLGYTVCLISNVFQDTADIIRQNGGYNGFDFLILSCEVGARKPEPKIYEASLAKLQGIKPQEVVYLDDREPLVMAANEMGFHGIHVTDHHEAINKVRQLIQT